MASKSERKRKHPWIEREMEKERKFREDMCRSGPGQLLYTDMACVLSRKKQTWHPICKNCVHMLLLFKHFSSDQLKLVIGIICC